MALDPITAITDLVNGVGGKLIDRLWPDPTQAQAAKLELLKMQQSGELAKMANETYFQGAIPIAGGRVGMPTQRPLVFPALSVVSIGLAGTAAQTSGAREVAVFGRLYDAPS